MRIKFCAEQPERMMFQYQYGASTWKYTTIHMPSKTRRPKSKLVMRLMYLNFIIFDIYHNKKLLD